MFVHGEPAPTLQWLITFTDPDSNSEPDSDPIPLVASQDGNLNLTPCIV